MRIMLSRHYQMATPSNLTLRHVYLLPGPYRTSLPSPGIWVLFNRVHHYSSGLVGLQRGSCLVSLPNCLAWYQPKRIYTLPPIECDLSVKSILEE